MPPVTTSDGSVGTPTPGPTPTPVPAPVPDPVPGSPADMWVETYVDTWNQAARTLCGCVSDDDTECYDELSFSDEFSACARRMAAEFPPEQLEPSLGCSASANTRLESCLRGSMCRDERIEGCISTFDDQMDECFRSGAAIEFFSALSECPGGPDEPFDP